MTDIDTTTYNITPDQAAVLLSASLVDRQTRSKVLRKYVAAHGNDDLLDLFVEFIAAANSVADNCRDSGIFARAGRPHKRQNRPQP